MREVYLRPVAEATGIPSRAETSSTRGELAVNHPYAFVIEVGRLGPTHFIYYRKSIAIDCVQ